jgi:hypothetical protein
VSVAGWSGTLSADEIPKLSIEQSIAEALAQGSDALLAFNAWQQAERSYQQTLAASGFSLSGGTAPFPPRSHQPKFIWLAELRLELPSLLESLPLKGTPDARALNLERLKEAAAMAGQTNGAIPARQSDLVVFFIKHLVRITTRRNSFYVTLGLSRLLYNYTTAETMDLYNLVIQDPERVHDDYYYRSRKGLLLKELKERFGELVEVAKGVRGEQRWRPAADSSTGVSWRSSSRTLRGVDRKWT